jgi:hypothetical protein
MATYQTNFLSKKIVPMDFEGEEAFTKRNWTFNMVINTLKAFASWRWNLNSHLKWIILLYLMSTGVQVQLIFGFSEIWKP